MEQDSAAQTEVQPEQNTPPASGDSAEKEEEYTASTSDNRAESESEAERKKKEAQEQFRDPAYLALLERRKRAEIYMNKKLQKYQPVQKKDRIEYQFDGEDRKKHTFFVGQKRKADQAVPFFGYYGKEVDKEASMMAIVKAAESGLTAINVHGNKKQKEYLARLAVEYGLSVENYDTSKFEKAKKKEADTRFTAGVTAGTGQQNPEPAAARTSAVPEEGAGKKDPDANQADNIGNTENTSNVGNTGNTDNNASGTQEVEERNVQELMAEQMRDLNRQALDRVAKGELVMGVDKNGNTMFASTRFGATQQQGDAREIRVVENEARQITDGKKTQPALNAPKQQLLLTAGETPEQNQENTSEKGKGAKTGEPRTSVSRHLNTAALQSGRTGKSRKTKGKTKGKNGKPSGSGKASRNPPKTHDARQPGPPNRQNIGNIRHQNHNRHGKGGRRPRG